MRKSHNENENQGIVAKYLDRVYSKLESYIELKRLYDILYDVQEVRKATANRERGMPKGTEGVYSAPLMVVEDEVTKRIENILEMLPEYHAVFKFVRGIGPRLAAGWIANTMIRYVAVEEDELENYSELQQKYKLKTRGEKFLVPTIRGISAFDNVSKFRAWCGYGVDEDGHAPKRVRGQKDLGYSPKMKVLSYKSGKQFVMQGDVYREIYDEKKGFLSTSSRYAVALENPEFCPRYAECAGKLEKTAKRLDRKSKKPSCKDHIHFMAMRLMIKKFQLDVYVNWRRSEGLPVPPPYDPHHKHHDEEQPQ